MTKGFPCHVDFPAAHSMDTTWFAVDRDGHVGVFDSGEPGAAPSGVDTFNDEPVETALGSLPVTGEPTFKLSAVFHPGLRPGVMPRRRKRLKPWPDAGGATLLVFQDDSVLTSEARALPGLHVSTEGRFVLVSLRPDGGLTRRDPEWSSFRPDIELTPRDPQWRAWNKFADAAVVARSYITGFNWYGPVFALARRGLFAYSAHTDRFYIAEPYGQLLAPQTPLRLDQLPAPVRDLLATRARLDVCFASSPYVQPVELVPCAAWANAVYLASDGFTVRPFPGTAADYRDSAAELPPSGAPGYGYEELYKPVVFDPPLDLESP